MTLVNPSIDGTSHPLSWDQIGPLLNKLADSLRAMLCILADEESAMKRLDREKIQHILMEKEQVLNVLFELEGKVMALVEPLMFTQDSRNWWLLIRQGGKGLNPEWETLCDDIELISGRIRAQGRKNETLIRRGRQIVGEAVRLMLSGLGQVAVYEERGTWRTQDTPGMVSFHG